jgi:hypothetical protein
LVSEEIVSFGSEQLEPGSPGIFDPHVDPWCTEQLDDPDVAHEQGTSELFGTVLDAHPAPGCVDDVLGANGGIVPLGPEHSPTPAGP